MKPFTKNTAIESNETYFYSDPVLHFILADTMRVTDEKYAPCRVRALFVVTLY